MSTQITSTVRKTLPKFFGFALLVTLATLLAFIFFVSLNARVGMAADPLGQWIKVGGPIGGLWYNVRINPTNKNIMFVTDAFSGVNRSTDGGQTWQASNTGIDARVGPSLDAIPVFSLTMDPQNSNIVWVGTQGARGLFKSTDGGLTFQRKDTGIVENLGLTVRNFEFH